MSKKIKRSYNLKQESLDKVAKLRTFFNSTFDNTLERIIDFSYQNMEAQTVLDESADTKKMLRELMLELNILKASNNLLTEKIENIDARDEKTNKNITLLNDRLTRHRTEINNHKTEIKGCKEEIEGIKGEQEKGFFKKLSGK